jgi:hypothetical protein
VQPKNSAEIILTNDFNRIKETKLPVHSPEAGFGEEFNPQGPLTLDARGLSLEEIADRIADGNWLTHRADD